jgi:hypothetical protein
MLVSLPVFIFINYYLQKALSAHAALSPAKQLTSYSKENYLHHGGFSVKACLK